MIPCRLIIDPPAAGVWNMALDEALLESAGQDGIASLRFYAWQEPTLSLGYFQPHANRQLHAASAGCALVRRASGGGAILHDRELTYSISLPAAHPLAARAEKLYQAAHGSLIETLRELGVVAALCEPPSADAGPRAGKSFLCFQRREAGDVLLGQHKIAGSAQRRQRGAVLQHGSVLWSGSPFAPELPGISDLIPAAQSQTAEADPIRRLLELWAPKLVAQLKLDLSMEPLGESLLAAAREIQRCKFGDPGWTCRR